MTKDNMLRKGPHMGAFVPRYLIDLRIKQLRGIKTSDYRKIIHIAMAVDILKDWDSICEDHYKTIHEAVESGTSTSAIEKAVNLTHRKSEEFRGAISILHQTINKK